MNSTARRRGFATLSVLLLALALVALVIGFSRYVSGLRSEIRAVEKQQNARIGAVATNRPPVLPSAKE